MSDEEAEVMSGGEEQPVKMAPPEESGPSEAELAMQKRRAGGPSTDELDEGARELLEANKIERAQMEVEIQELRSRSEQRKAERIEEEKRLNEKRAEEEARRKAEEEERKRKKEEEESSRREARDAKMAEMAKWKNPPKANFVISKRDTPLTGEEGDEPQGERKSREQLEAERRAILAQRIRPLDISGFDSSKLADKAKELNSLIYRLESEKYDLEKRFKEQQYDMMELAERARAVNQVGRGGLKRIQMGPDESDPIQEKFAGAPSKVEMFSKFERQQDKRDYGTRHTVFHGPTWIMPADRITPCRKIQWDENTGLPSYEEIEGAMPEEGEEEEE